jgi:uncharacterized 2Fe-2S/4Fe-4S cluster protein (DUF4445 family)
MKRASRDTGLQRLWPGQHPAPIGFSPYRPAFYEAAAFRAEDLGFAYAEFSIHTLPQVSGFIGGDTLAASLAVDMENHLVGALLVDLGINGELVLKGEDRLFATSCAKGPAFEWASLACGMQADPGAINAVTIDDHQKVTAVSLIQSDQASEIKPAGICGDDFPPHWVRYSAVPQYYHDFIKLLFAKPSFML